MTPDDLDRVQRSWSELGRRRDPLVAELSAYFTSLPSHPSPLAALVRAEWLVSAVDELVGLLSAPSRLADRARALGQRWPDPLTAPSFAIEGRAWMAAASVCARAWTATTETAWRQAWLLLSDVLAAEALSPFSDGA